MGLILASASPRRRQLLHLLCDDFTVCTAAVDESGFAADSPAALARLLAAQKCRAVAQDHPADCVIGCDTVVELDGQALGKPADADEAAAMLHSYSGRWHQVHTGVCVQWGQRQQDWVETTWVLFAELTRAEIDDYIATGEPFDKAGGYGIQGPAARFVRQVDGCYFNVMGLPVRSLYAALRDMGWPTPMPRTANAGLPPVDGSRF